MKSRTMLIENQWECTTLEEVADLTVGFVGKTTSHYVAKGIRFLRSQNVEPFRLNLRDEKYIDEEFHNKIQKSKLETGDVVIVRTGNPGASAVIPEKNEEWNCSDLVIVKPNRARINSTFLAAYLNLSYGIIRSHLVGAVQQHFNVGSAKKLVLMLPPIDTQNRIARIIDILNEKIAVNQNINDNLLQQAQAIFTQEFLNVEGIPDGWKESSLLGIADYLNGLAMQKFRPKDDEQGLPVLKIKELRQGACDASSELCSPSIKPEYIVHDGDVIFSWSGSLLVDFWCGGTCGLNQHLFKVTSDTYDKWFYYAWTNHHLQRFVAIAADMATTMGHIKREELSKAVVLIPSQSDYDRIGGLLAPLYDLVIANRIENRKLAALRDELLPQLMSGQLDVSEVDL